MVFAAALIDWLLDSDPALRWQVERDLVGAPQDMWGATRARIATEGFEARLLALQDSDGQWAGGSFFPSDFDFHGPEAAEGAGQPWTATTWTLNTLRDWGLDASALAGTGDLLAANSRWDYEGLPYPRYAAATPWTLWRVSRTRSPQWRSAAPWASHCGTGLGYLSSLGSHSRSSPARTPSPGVAAAWQALYGHYEPIVSAQRARPAEH